jgi:ferredoxin
MCVTVFVRRAQCERCALCSRVCSVIFRVVAQIQDAFMASAGRKNKRHAKTKAVCALMHLRHVDADVSLRVAVRAMTMTTTWCDTVTDPAMYVGGEGFDECVHSSCAHSCPRSSRK